MVLDFSEGRQQLCYSQLWLKVVPGSLVSSTDRAQTGQRTLFTRTHMHTSGYVTTGSSEVHTSAAYVRARECARICVMCACAEEMWASFSCSDPSCRLLPRLSLSLCRRSSHKHNFWGFEYIKKPRLHFHLADLDQSHLSPSLSESAQSLVMRIRRGHVNRGSRKQSAGRKVPRAFPSCVVGKTARKLRFLAGLVLKHDNVIN